MEILKLFFTKYPLPDNFVYWGGFAWLFIVVTLVLSIDFISKLFTKRS